MYNHKLDTFLRAAEQGSFTKAAEELYITTTAVIKQINHLESELGVKLFCRSHRGLTLTEAGQSLFRDAKQIIQYCADAEERARNAMAKRENLVRIGTSPMTPAQNLTALLHQVQALDPDLRIQLIPYENTPENARDILKNMGREIDLVVGIFDEVFLEYRQCAGFRLSQTPLCCSMSRKHPLARKERLTLRDLHGEQLLLIQPNWSKAMDDLRRDLIREHPQIRIVDFDFYDLSIYNRCENSSDILVTIPQLCQPHPLLKTVSVDWDYSMSYGLLHAPAPSASVERFLRAVKRVTQTNHIT